MKKRGMLSNILYIVILVALVGFLLVQFNILGLEDSAKSVASTLLLVLAVISVACVEIVFPVLDNKELLRDRKYVIMATVKSLLFLAALVILFLYEPFGVIKSTGFAIVGFVVLYFIQFFISLDPKPVAEAEDESSESEPVDGAAEAVAFEIESEVETVVEPEADEIEEETDLAEGIETAEAETSEE